MRLKPLLSVLAILFSALLTTAEAQEVNLKKQTANERKFNRLMHRDKAIIIDVRSAEEFAAGHIPGAINIDVQKDGFAQRVKALGPYESYLIYCRSGKRSEEALKQLAANTSLDNVYHLKGGYLAWTAAERPVKGAGENLLTHKKSEADTSRSESHVL